MKSTKIGSSGDPLWKPCLFLFLTVGVEQSVSRKLIIKTTSPVLSWNVRWISTWTFSSLHLDNLTTLIHIAGKMFQGVYLTANRVLQLLRIIVQSTCLQSTSFFALVEEYWNSLLDCCRGHLSTLGSLSGGCSVKKIVYSVAGNRVSVRCSWLVSGSLMSRIYLAIYSMRFAWASIFTWRFLLWKTHETS